MKRVQPEPPKFLTHPLRELTRVIVGREPIKAEALDDIWERLDGEYPCVRRDDLPKTAEAVAAAAIGLAEGAAQAVSNFVDEQTKAALPKTAKKEKAGLFRGGTAFAVGTSRMVAKESNKLLALAGLARPPDAAKVKKLVQQITTLAQANKAAIELNSTHTLPFPSLDDFSRMGQAVLGLNSGKDKISEVRIVRWAGADYRETEIHAFDRRGFHVFNINLSMDEPGVLRVNALQASHGRNCEDLYQSFGGAHEPGRGNTALIAAGLEALIVEGAKSGMHAIVTYPGSPNVQRLYEKMGFTSPGQSGPWSRKTFAWTTEKMPVVSGIHDLLILRRQLDMGSEATMTLDLTNPRAVQQALIGFQLTRALVKDVPKDVASKMKKAGLALLPPSINEYEGLAENSHQTRVLRRSPPGAPRPRAPRSSAPPAPVSAASPEPSSAPESPGD